MIIKQLKDYIAVNGYKNKKIAEKLNVSPGHLSYVLNGKRDLSIELERRIRDLVK